MILRVLVRVFHLATPIHRLMLLIHRLLSRNAANLLSISMRIVRFSVGNFVVNQIDIDETMNLRFYVYLYINFGVGKNLRYLRYRRSR